MTGPGTSIRVLAAPALIRELCVRLDGMPLAIEIAATRGVSLVRMASWQGWMISAAVGGHRASAERHNSLAPSSTGATTGSTTTSGGCSATRISPPGRPSRRHRLPRWTAGRGRRPRRQADGQELARAPARPVAVVADLGTIRSYALDRLAACGEEAMVGTATSGGRRHGGPLRRAADRGRDWSRVRPRRRRPPAAAAGQLAWAARKRVTILPITSASHICAAFLGESASTIGPSGVGASWEAAGELRDAATWPDGRHGPGIRPDIASASGGGGRRQWACGALASAPSSRPFGANFRRKAA